jgi:hypothetical protein
MIENVLSKSRNRLKKIIYRQNFLKFIISVSIFIKYYAKNFSKNYLIKIYFIIKNY